MKIMLPIIAFITATIGGIATFDWEDRTSEFIRWCFAILFGIALVLFLTGCAEVRTLYHACRDGHCS